MSEREVVVKLLLQAAQFNKESAGAARGLAAVEAEAGKASAEFKRLEAETLKAAAELRRLEAEAVRAAADLRKLQDAERGTAIASAKLEGEVKQLTARLKTLEAESGRAQAHLRKMEDASKKAAAEMRQMEAETKRLAAELVRVQSQSQAAAGGLGKLGSAAGALKGALAVLGLGVIAKEAVDLGVSAINAAEDLNKLKGSITAIVAANSDVRNSSGELVNGIEKIKAVGKEVEAVFKQLQVDGLKTSDTTKGLIEKFSAALAPGQAAGMDLDQIRKLTVAASVAMSALGVEASQARSEIRALLTGDELDNAQLAQALGFRSKADIEKLRQEGRLYDVLMSKMGDFLAAGELQSRSLTGILSSLDDFRQKLLAVAGDRATESLAEGFGRILDSIQNADGSLTPLGQSLTDLANHAGVVLDGVSQDFVRLAKVIIDTAALADKFMKNWARGNMRQQVMSQNLEGVDTIKQQVITVNGKKMTVAQAMGERARLVGVRDTKILWENQRPGALERRTDAARQVGAYDAALRPAMAALKAWTDPKFIESQIAQGDQEILGDAPKPTGRTTAKDYTTTGRKPPPKVDPKAAANAEDKAIANLLRQMRQRLQASDARGMGFTGRIEIMEEFVQKLSRYARATEELDDLHHDITIAEIERGKKQAQEAQKEADKLVEIAKDGAETQARIHARYWADELAGLKDANATVEATLKERYTKGEVAAEEYFDAIAKLREGELGKEYSNTVGGLQNQRTILQKLFEVESGRTGKEYDAAKVEGLRNQIKAIDVELETATNEYGRNVTRVWFDAKQDIRLAHEEGATQGLEAAVGGVTKLLGVAIPAGLEKGIVTALGNALKASGMDKAGGGLGAVAGGPLGGILEAFVNIASLGIAQTQKNLAKNVEGDKALDGAILNLGPDSRAKDQTIIDAEMAEMQSQFTVTGGIFRNPAADQARMDKLAEIRRHKEAEADEREAKRRQEQRDANEAQEEENFQNDLKRIERRRQARLAELEAEKATIVTQAREMTRALQAREGGERNLWAIEKAIHRERLLSKQKENEANKADLESLEDRRKALQSYVNDPANFENDKAPKRAELLDVEAQIRDHKLQDIERETLAIESAADRQRRAIQKAYETAAAGAIEQLRRIRAEQEDALAGTSNERKVRSIYGLESAALADFRDKQDLIKLSQKQIGEAQGRIDGLRSQESGLLNTFASNFNLRLINRTGGAISDPLGGTLENGESRTFMAEFHTFVEDMDLFRKFIAEQQGTIINRTTGRQLTESDFVDAAGLFNSIQSQMGDGQSTISDLQKQIANTKREIELQYATIRQGGTDANKDLEAELMALRAGDDPEKLKELRRAQVDAEIDQRRKELEQAGILGGDVVDKATQASIRSNLEQMRSLMKAEADEEKPSDSNPIPVRVVEMPKTFALPTSSYFRERAAGTQVLFTDGAIRVDGSGLGEEALGKAIETAIVKATPTVTKAVNRENTINDSRLTV